MQHAGRKLGDRKALAVRRFVALALALTILSSGVSGCSQPIDTGSSVPAASQPFVALLALVGLGIGLTAWHHHNVNSHGGSGGPTIFGAAFLIPPFISGYKPVSLVTDPVNFTLGAVEVPTGGGTGKYTEIQATSSSASPFGTYSLPTGYVATAVAIDPQTGITWFVDATGKVQACDAMTTSSTTCSSLGVFSDGLGAGSRSIAADPNFVIVIMDGGLGKVKYWVLPTPSGTPATGTYTSTTTSTIYGTDAIEATVTGGASGFTAYHQDGTSDIITFTVSGSTVTVNNQPSYLFTPAPLVGPSDFLQESSDVAFFSFTGAAAGAYSLSKYVAAAPVGLGHPTVKSELIAFNGQLSPTGAHFFPPLSSIRSDADESSIWAIDQAGDIVNFIPF